MPESRINVEDMTPDKVNENQANATQPDDGKAKGLDTDLSRGGYMAPQTNGAEAENTNDWPGRREDKARTQNRAEEPKHLRQGTNQRVIHSKQDHVVNLPSNLIQSEDQFGQRKGASFLQNNDSGLPSQESETSDEEEDEEEEEDEVSMGKT